MQKDRKVQLAVPQLEWRVFTAVTPRGNPHSTGQRPADRPTTRNSALWTGPQPGTAPCGLAHNTGQRPGVCTLWNSSLVFYCARGKVWVLCGTVVFYCAPAPQSVRLLCETSVFYRALRNMCCLCDIIYCLWNIVKMRTYLVRHLSFDVH